MRGNKIFSVDKFLGLNESADGETELKPGEASRVENFYITDSYNLKTRPGISKYIPKEVKPGELWSAGGAEKFRTVYISGRKYFMYWYAGDDASVVRAYSPESPFYDEVPGLFGDIVDILQIEDDVFVLSYDRKTGEIHTPKIYLDYTYVPSGMLDVAWRVAGGYSYQPYIPLVRSDCKPDGSGQDMEALNILTDKFRVQYVSEEQITEYTLPKMADRVVGVHFAGYAYEAENVGSYDVETHKFILKTPPAPGVDVVFVCQTEDADLKAAKERFLKMRFHEYFNGDTDTRVFFYGDGSNVCYYTGQPAFADSYGYSSIPSYEGMQGDGTNAKPSFYVPAGNEIAVDFSDSKITAMVRHYSRLLVFKPDGTAAITYEPVTLEDGKVIAGFFMRPVSRDFGNEAEGQVLLVNNYPRSFTHGSIYEWRLTSYRDERYAKCVSEKVSRTLAKADLTKAVACDDGIDKTYYVFLNDDEGTVLVNRYDIEAWSIYKSKSTTNIKQCEAFDGKVVFLRDESYTVGEEVYNNSCLYFFDTGSNYDYSRNRDTEGLLLETQEPVQAVWESGFMDFGAPNKLKFSSKLWVSMFPESGSEMEVTVKTDKRGEYMVKTAGYNFLDFSRMDFSNFSFLTYAAPKVRRIMLKVKKFVYYKLIFRVTKPGARATVLGYEQQVRYSSDVK